MARAVSLVSPTFSFVPKFSLKPLLFSPLSTPLPSKATKRKNYLRPKILKTLTKPFPSPAPTNPVIPLESPPETKPFDMFVFEPPSDEMPNQVVEETDEVEEFQVSETSGVAGENSDSFGKISAHSVLEFGFYFVGIFIFQTLVAVWVMGNGGVSQDKDGDLDGFQRNNKSKNGKFLDNGNVGSVSRNVSYWDDSELVVKVEEIRAMAREARKMEEKELKKGDEEGDMIDESLNSKERLGVEKEIGARLNTLEKKLNSKRENFPASYMRFSDKLKDGEDAGEMNKTLFVKKKFKFRAPEKNSRSGVKPKGFPGLKDGSASSNKNAIATSGSETKEVDDEKRVPSQNSDFLRNNREKAEKIEEGLGALHNNTSAGSESSQERPSTEVMKSRKLRDLDTQDSQVLTKENQEARTKFDKHAFLQSSKSRGVRNKPPANKVKDNLSDIKTDPWWMNLPYVLAIFMQRGVDHEGPEGLFTLRISSKSQEQSETSCTVAFEDHSDANNFCYLLECFFEDLGDFSAEVVAMSVKELCEAIKSHAKKVIVVKKGQLKLYAGQPFAEVEMALHSLIEDNQSATIVNSE